MGRRATPAPSGAAGQGRQLQRPPRARLPGPPAREGSPELAPGGSPLAAAVLRLQRIVGNRAVHQLLADGGAPLDAVSRHELERFHGCDLSAVRIRTGGGADSLCQAAGGDALTIGDDIVVRTDRPLPPPPALGHLLAHEVAHVVQQRHGPVEGAPGPEGVQVSQRGDRFEQAADRAAHDVISGGS